MFGAGQWLEGAALTLLKWLSNAMAHILDVILMRNEEQLAL